MSQPKKTLKQRFAAMFGKRFRAGGYSAAASAIVIAIAVLLNLMVGSLPTTLTQIDLTDQSIYSLSDQTKRIAASLDKDVTLYLICNTGNEDTTVQRLLQRYEDLSDHIHMEVMDPALHPTFLDSYELEISRLYENSVLVDCDGRYRLVGYDEIFVTSYDMDYYSYNYYTTTSFNGESALTSAIHYVSSDDLPKVYMLTGHGETELDDRITEMLSQDNFESESLSLLSLESVPEDAAAIEAAGDKLLELAPNIRLIKDNNTQDDLLSGEVGAAVLYTSMVTLAKMTNPDLKVVFPEEGIGFGVMGQFIPSDAPNAENAYKFMDYILQPEVSAQCFEYMGYYCTNKDAEQYISEEYRDFLTLPEGIDMENMEMIENISAEAVEVHNRVYTEFKSACGQ